ncbi:MAG: cytochrome c3 family protein [Rhodoblastus sp.]|uniref:cytochrome c3 family protein n=1 Tax=Rhodoblastus sp. TaxID=1962975 RepID=UPI003F969BF2
MTRALRKLLAAGLALAAASAARAEDAGGRTPSPHPAKGQGEHCVADTDFMRRNHMLMMLDHRKEAVHEGIRAPQYSLAGCVSCHSVKGADGKAVSFASPDHFCRSCHGYAAVKIDCFECHASKPETPQKGADASAPRDEDAASLAAFLREAKPSAEQGNRP